MKEQCMEIGQRYYGCAYVYNENYPLDGTYEVVEVHKQEAYGPLMSGPYRTLITDIFAKRNLKVKMLVIKSGDEICDLMHKFNIYQNDLLVMLGRHERQNYLSHLEIVKLQCK